MCHFAVQCIHCTREFVWYTEVSISKLLPVAVLYEFIFEYFISFEVFSYAEVAIPVYFCGQTLLTDVSLKLTAV